MSSMREFLKYLVVGVSNVAVVFVVVNILVFATGIYSGVGIVYINGVAFVISLINSYVWNRAWTFGHTRNRGTKTFLAFSLVTVLGFVFQTGTLYYLTTLVVPPAGISPHLWVNIAVSVSVVIGVLWNFSGYKLFVFRGGASPVPPLRLLFITQKVDKDDDLLGVYHRWIEELSKKAEKISVICLYQGRTELPANVKVYSLGKEKGASKFRQLLNFYRYIVQLLPSYNAVFVHMNTIYVLLAWWLWRATGKKLVLWFAHYRPDWQLRFSNAVVEKIVTSVAEAANIRSRKIEVIGQGIDTERFAPPKTKKRADSSASARAGRDGPFRLLFLGRISPVKDLETLVLAVSNLRKRGYVFTLDVVGEPTDKDKAYADMIRAKVKAAGFEGLITFKGRVSNLEAAKIYGEHDAFVNLTPTGSFDKSILEAMAAGLPVVIANRAYERIFPADLKSKLLFRQKDAEDLAEKLAGLIETAPAERGKMGATLREIVVRDHNVVHLAERLVKVFNEL